MSYSKFIQKMSPFLAVLLFCVVFSASAKLQAEDEMDRMPPLLRHRTNMEIIRNIQEIMRSRTKARGREKKLGVAKLMNHLKNRFLTIPFKFNYMAFKPDFL